MTAKTKPSWTTRFWAVVKYELLWNIRKKKFVGMIIVAFALATLSLALPVILSNVTGEELSQNPDYVVNTGAGIGGLGMFLFAVVTVMNSISGEFESGTIVPLLTKPVSRTMIFLGKLFAAFITLLSAYTILILYMTIGGTLVYGPQNNLHLVPLSLLGIIFSTFVYISIVLAIGSISKSSLIAALGTFGIFIALSISSSMISMFTDQAWVLNYLPGSGATGYIEGLNMQSPYLPGMAVSMGTDGIAANLINYFLYPSTEVTFYKIGGITHGQPTLWIELYSEPISLVLLRATAVATIYIFAFLFIAWYALKRAEVLE
jgi:ABC-type transport system involved in multi-copper enzyme maturation permease subunit